MAIAITTSNTNPLSDSNSFLFQKTGGANDQGKGVSYDFTVDNASKAKVMKISFDYIVNSGTFTAGGIGPSGADSDVIVYVYDITNSQLIQPSSFKLFSNSSTVPDSYSGYFQTAYNSTSYRLIFHQATSTTNNFELKIDSIKVERASYQYGTPITDWQAYTPTISGVGTVAQENGHYWRRVGSNIEVRGEFVCGTPTASVFSISLPSGLSINSSIISSSVTASNAIGHAYSTGGTNASVFPTTSQGPWPLFIDTTTSTTVIYLAQGTSSSKFVAANGNGPFATSSRANYYFTVPITGFSSSVQMSDNAAQNIVSAKYTGNNAATSGNAILGQTLQWDTSGSYSTSTGKFTVPVAGYYQVTMMYNNTGSLTYTVYLNGVSKEVISLSNASGLNQGTSTIYCNAGQTLDVRPSGTMGAVAGSSNQSWVTYTKVTGPAAIAASETVAASYYCSANIAITANTQVNFDSKDFDTHGAVTVGSSWKFTAPISGTYSIGSLYRSQSSQTTGIIVYKNGSAISSFATMESLGRYSQVLIKLNAGDYIDIRPAGNNTFWGGASNADSVSKISIVKVGI